MNKTSWFKGLIGAVNEKYDWVCGAEATWAGVVKEGL